MRDQQNTYNYAIIRIVPRVEREEFINVGAIVSCPAKKFLEARIEFNEARLRALHPSLDEETLESINAHLATLPAICAGGPEGGPIGELPPNRRFEWLTAPRSTMIQTSPVHTGRCKEPGDLLEHLLNTMVRE